jgi:hypothetical protein
VVGKPKLRIRYQVIKWNVKKLRNGKTWMICSNNSQNLTGVQVHFTVNRTRLVNVSDDW